MGVYGSGTERIYVKPRNCKLYRDYTRHTCADAAYLLISIAAGKTDILPPKDVVEKTDVLSDLLLQT